MLEKEGQSPSETEGVKDKTSQVRCSSFLPCTLQVLFLVTVLTLLVLWLGGKTSEPEESGRLSEDALANNDVGYLGYIGQGMKNAGVGLVTGAGNKFGKGMGEFGKYLNYMAGENRIGNGLVKMGNKFDQAVDYVRNSNVFYNTLNAFKCATVWTESVAEPEKDHAGDCVKKLDKNDIVCALYTFDNDKCMGVQHLDINNYWGSRSDGFYLILAKEGTYDADLNQFPIFEKTLQFLNYHGCTVNRLVLRPSLTKGLTEDQDHIQVTWKVYKEDTETPETNEFLQCKIAIKNLVNREKEMENWRHLMTGLEKAGITYHPHGNPLE